MSMNYENRRRRAGVKVFLAGYLLFILAVLIINAVQSHQNGGGWVF